MGQQLFEIPITGDAVDDKSILAVQQQAIPCVQAGEVRISDPHFDGFAARKNPSKRLIPDPQRFPSHPIMA